jgi:hypothetical protein
MVRNAFTTYQAKGNREDLSDKIFNIDPFDTPVISMAGRRTVKNRTYDWQTENLPATDVTNAREEAYVLVARAPTPTVRQSNVAQISTRDAVVSGSQEAADAAGKNGEMAHQMAMQSKVLKSDMEMIACSRQAQDIGADGVARKTESIPHAIARAKGRPPLGIVGDSVVVVGTGGTLPTSPTAAWTASTTTVAFTEALLGTAMEKAYNNGAEPTKLITSAAVKRTISTFEGRNSSQVMVGKTEVVATVDIIATDFGRITALPSRWVPADLALQLDPEYVAIAFYRTFRQYPIAKLGDAETRMIIVEWGTEVRNGSAHLIYEGVKQGATIPVP